MSQKPTISARVHPSTLREICRLIPITNLSKTDLIDHALRLGLPKVEEVFGKASAQIEPLKRRSS